MKLILTLLFLGIILFCGWTGYKKGMIMGVGSLLIFVIINSTVMPCIVVFHEVNTAALDCVKNDHIGLVGSVCESFVDSFADFLDVVTVDNLDFRYGGSHGVGGSGGLANYDSYGNLTSIGGCANLTVTNCLFSWIGGSILSGTTRFGNAVEIFGSVDGYLVQNNWIYQIYDTGVTHQISGSSVGNTHMRDILYKDNLIEYCHWSIEFYNQNCECCNSRETPIHVRIVEDVLSEGNIVRMGGYGWGSRIRKDGATLYNSFGLSRVASETRNFHAKDNIFFRCTGGMYRIYANASEDNLTFESNLWVQDFGGILAWYKNGSYAFLADAEDYITTTHLKEKNTQGVYFYAP